MFYFAYSSHYKYFSLIREALPLARPGSWSGGRPVARNHVLWSNFLYQAHRVTSAKARGTALESIEHIHTLKDFNFVFYSQSFLDQNIYQPILLPEHSSYCLPSPITEGQVPPCLVNYPNRHWPVQPS